MIRTLRLKPPEGIGVRLEDAVPTPHELPMAVALESASDPGALVFWRNPSSGITGIFHRLGRTAWPDARVTRIHAIVLRPDAGPGAAGLELVLTDGTELPVLISRPFREEFAEWLESTMPALEAFLELEVHWKDYGWDR
jgi:hypothetical protein